MGPDEHRRLTELRVKAKRADKVAKDAKRDLGDFERELFDRMVAQGWVPNETSIKFGGVTHAPAETPYGTVQDVKQLVEWARENMPQLLEEYPKIRSGILNEEVRKRLDNGEPPPPGAGYWVKTYISTHGAKASETLDADEDT